MDKVKKRWLEKVDKLLDCDGVLILVGAKSFANFISTFFPGELKRKDNLFSSCFKLRNLQVMYAKEPRVKEQTIVDLGW